ncbi:MAG: hypothetical protein LW825_05180 [Candidatus Jidaibacter sp.]|jgi:DNA-binding response OmpR family regulator|nr:hypothetical protein [Candidatus Jidaibacter sp.]
MSARQLYNIETDTLITLNPKNLGLGVKGVYSQCYFLKKEDFAILYFLCISRPHVVGYKDFSRAFEDIGIQYPGNKKFDKNISNFKKLLVSYGVKDLIVKVRGYGYVISNKWVPPELNKKEARNTRFNKLIRLVETVFMTKP